jgi:DNA ligase-1
MLSEKLEGRIEPTVWPQLYAKASTGKIKTWQVGVTKEEDETAIIWAMHGLLDGKKRLVPKPIKIGKNIGKKNETTPYQQACNEALSKYNKQLDKKYIDEIPDGTNDSPIYLPMLAKKIQDSWVRYPCMTQCKLNGVRSLSKKMTAALIDITSRKFKSYNATMVHLQEPILEMLDLSQIFDGELYFYGWTFQQILRRVKKLRPDSNVIQLWVYDMADDTMLSEDRNAMYNELIPDDHPNIIKVPTRIANNWDDIEEYHRENIGLGFEGTIIRNYGEKYRFDYRSPNLLKKKDFIDEEFKIVGGEFELIAEEQEDGSISEQLAVVFTCEVNDGTGRTFNARPRGSIPQRVKWYNELEQLKGELLTVRFLEYSEDNIPTGNTVGIAIRNYE